MYNMYICTPPSATDLHSHTQKIGRWLESAATTAEIGENCTSP